MNSSKVISFIAIIFIISIVIRVPFVILDGSYIITGLGIMGRSFRLLFLSKNKIHRMPAEGLIIIMGMRSFIAMLCPVCKWRLIQISQIMKYQMRKPLPEKIKSGRMGI